MFSQQFEAFDSHSATGRTAWEIFATRLTTADRSRSLAPAVTREGLFHVVYRFQNEQLLELINRTAHAAALSALVERQMRTVSISAFTCAASVALRRSTWP
jgi:hypothetical protein